MTELNDIRKKMLNEIEQELNEKQNTSLMPDKPIMANDSNIDSIISKYPNVIIDMWAPWCGPCRMLSPVIDKLAKDLQGKVVFAKVNTDENQNTSLKYKIMSIPSILMFKDGKLIDKTVGALPEDMLRKWISSKI